MKTDRQIVRVYGKADNFDLEFTPTGGNEWECTIPPDMTDGQYATEIYALDSEGYFAYWTGILYMLKGRVHLCLKESKYKIQLLPQKLELIIIKDGGNCD